MPKADRLEGRTICEFDLGTETDRWIQPTIYNPSTILPDGTVLCRLEERGDEISSQIAVFEVTAGWRLSLVESAPRFRGMQDPYYLGEFPDLVSGGIYHVIGGVKITVDPSTRKITDWQDHFFRYRSNLEEVFENGAPKPFATGVRRAKDTRFVWLPGRESEEKQIAVCPRPQGRFGGIGRIGYFKTDNLETLQNDIEAYFMLEDESTLISDLLEEDEWGGVNQMMVQRDGSILLIGHRARRTGSNGTERRKYRPFAAMLDPDSGQLIGAVKELDVVPDEFPSVVAKRPELEDVIFSGGIMLDNDDPDRVVFIGGAKDASVVLKVIDRPYELTPARLK